MIPLLDLDVFVYQAGYSSEKTKHTLVNSIGEQIELPIGMSKKQVNEELRLALELDPAVILSTSVMPLSFEFAVASINNLIWGVLNELGETEFKGFLSASNDSTNFRYKIAVTKPYKGSRKDVKRPVHYHALREYLCNTYDIIMCTGKEADDGLAQEQYKLNPNSVIVSIDKDLLQVPGWHYNFRKNEYYCITEFQGAYNLYTQVLTGDNADNIPGLSGVGPITAKKILKSAKNVEDLHNIVKKEYNVRKLDKMFYEVLALCKLLTE